MNDYDKQAAEMAERCAKALTNRWGEAMCQTREDEIKTILRELPLASLLADRAMLQKCCGYWTADGKPVPCGSTLVLYPNNDINREPMKLKIPEASKTCWYLSEEDNRAAIKQAMKEGK